MHANHRPTLRIGLAAFGGVLLSLPLAGAAAMAGPASAGPVSRPAPACEMTPLPVPAGVTASEVTGGDHTGRNLAGRAKAATADGGSTIIALQWIDGRPHVVNTDPLQTYSFFSVADVNSQAVVVGSAWEGTSHVDAWAYRAGQTRILPTLHPGDEAMAVAVNARGDIVGNNISYADGAEYWSVVVWPAGRPGTVRELTVAGPAPEFIWAVDIDDDGAILANAGRQPSEEQYPYVWPAHGTGYPLAAADGSGYPSASAIHAGQVAGTVMAQMPDGSGWSVAARWDLPSPTAQIVATTEHFAYAVNRQGTLATQSALVYRDGTVRDLGGYPRVLSDRHTAAGADRQDLTGHAVVWTGC